MTPQQAAEVIGCNSSQVRALIRAGKIKARRIPMPLSPGAYYYQIELREARRYAKTSPGGWPRGQSRKTKRVRSQS